MLTRTLSRPRSDGYAIKRIGITAPLLTININLGGAMRQDKAS